MKIHFIGIGGIGMSALAGIAKKSGFFVTGSDQEKSLLTDNLKKQGAKVYKGHKEENLSKDTNLVVISQAIKKDNPELKKAKKLGIQIKDRAEYLGELMEDKKAIAVSGTHGKTTISAMISAILEQAGLDPTVAVGGLVPEIKNSNWKKGESDLMVVEACEYRSSFLKLHPWAVILSNIEKEHLDCFKDLDEIIKVFYKFLKLVPNNGFAVVSADDLNIQKILKNNSFDFPIITYGDSESQAQWKIADLKEENRQVSFSVFKNNQKFDDFVIKIPGKHNALNALAAIIVALKLGVNLKKIKEVLANFKGAKRRMEVKGEKRGILVIDDYGHHPTEIEATLKAIKGFYPERKNLWCIFQPHQYSRTKLLFKEFLDAFTDADSLIILDIYEVRDLKKDIEAVNSYKLAEEIKKKKDNVFYLESFNKASDFLLKNVKTGDIILTIGAGPVFKVGELFLRNEDRKK